jgi:hypothetical protein
VVEQSEKQADANIQALYASDQQVQRRYSPRK